MEEVKTILRKKPHTRDEIRERVAYYKEHGIDAACIKYNERHRQAFYNWTSDVRRWDSIDNENVVPLIQDESYKVKPGPKPPLDPETEKEIYEYYKTHTQIETAAHFKIGVPRVKNFIGKMKIEEKAKKDLALEMRQEKAKAKKELEYQQIIIPSEEVVEQPVQQKAKSKVAVLISDDTQSIIDILKGL